MLKPGAEFVSDETGTSVEFNFAAGLDREYTHSYQVKRAEFDVALFANARRKGARTYERTVVTDVTFGAGGTRPRVSAQARMARLASFTPADPRCFRSRRFFGHQVSLQRNEHNSTAAVFAHFRNVEYRVGRMAGYITVHLVKDGWFWMIPLPGDIMSVGFVGNQAAFKNRRSSVQDFFFEKVRDSASVSARMARAELASEVITTGNYHTARSPRAAKVTS